MTVSSSEMDQKPFWTKNGQYLVTNELFLDLVFTSACSCACPFCISRTKEYARADFEQWKKSLRETFERFAVRHVIVLGGEAAEDPLFWEKLSLVGEMTGRHRHETAPDTKAAGSHGIDADRHARHEVILTTNGIALRDPDFLEKLCCSPVTAVNISYMNYDKQKNDRIFQADTLDREELLQICRRLHESGRTLRLNANVYRDNLDTCEEMESFVRCFTGCCDAVKFSPLMATDMFDTREEVTAYTRRMAIPEEEIRLLFEAFAGRHRLLRRTKNVLGFVDYAQLSVFGQTVFLKYAQVEDKYDPDREIPTLKLYPNGALSNTWDYKKNILAGHDAGSDICPASGAQGQPMVSRNE